MCTGGTAGPGAAQVTEAGSGMEMEEGGGAEDDGGCKLDIEFDEDGSGAFGGRTVLKGCEEKGGCGGPLGCEAVEDGRGAAGGWWLAEGGRLCDWVRTGGWDGGGWSCCP